MVTQKTKKKYPGKLGKPIPDNQAMGAALQRGNNWKLEFDAEALVALLEHYEIVSNDESRWFRLALSLARDHVPRFHVQEGKPVGRPLKQKNEYAILIREYGNAPKKRGAPIKRTSESERTLFEAVTYYKTALSEARKTGNLSDDKLQKPITETLEALEGRKITDKAAIEVLVRHHAHSRKESFATHRNEVKKLQKRLSYARKLIPTIQKYS